MPKMSKLEATLLYMVRSEGLPEPNLEYRFMRERRWRFDMAWVPERLAVEVEGGVWSRGRHTRGKGFIADAEKYNEATLAGWRVLRVTGQQIESGQAVEWIRRGLCHLA